MPVSRTDINKHIDNAIRLLQAAKLQVQQDRLTRAENEVDEAVKILVKVAKDISNRKEWFLT